MTFTLPAYGDRSLADVVPSVARALGVPLDGHPAGFVLPDAPSYVVFLMRDRDTQRVYRLYDFSKAQLIRPNAAYCVAGKVNSADSSA